jgi:hypothetical protein
VLLSAWIACLAMFVSVVFVEEAKAKLDKIEGQAKKEKRQVIIDLAKRPRRKDSNR